jgi:hypothetical protein
VKLKHDITEAGPVAGSSSKGSNRIDAFTGTCQLKTEADRLLKCCASIVDQTVDEVQKKTVSAYPSYFFEYLTIDSVAASKSNAKE